MTESISIRNTGESQQATVPDTLDLAERARLAVHGIMGSIDPELLTMYGLIFYATPRPHLSHWASAENTCDPKLAESLTLLRTMCGSDEMRELEARYFGNMVSRIDGNGSGLSTAGAAHPLTAAGAQPRLYWDCYTPKRPWRNSYASAFYGEGRNEDFCSMAGAGRMIRTLMAGAPPPAVTVSMAGSATWCTAWPVIAIRKGDYAYYPEKGGWGEPCCVSALRLAQHR
jgi:hypothetical protein